MGKFLSSDDIDMTLRSERYISGRAWRTASVDDAEGIGNDYDDDDGYASEIARMIQLDGMISVEWGDVESLSLD